MLDDSKERYGMEIDLSRPNKSRIYDYILGGSHNFPSDRAVAERLTEAFPALPKWMRLMRWFLHAAVAEFNHGQLRNIIDIGSLLPTQGHVHEHVPATSRVLYSDPDQDTVIYAQQILGENAAIQYVQTDLSQTDQLLAEAQRVFGGERQVGISLVNLALFIDDQLLQTLMKRLHEWAAPGSLLAISLIQMDQISPEAAQVFETYRAIGQPIYPRTAQQVRGLLGGWKVQGPGFRSVEEYVAARSGMEIKVERTTSGGDEALVGAVLLH